MDNLLDLARTLRTALYNLTSATFYGVEIDVVLHFVFSAVIFVLVARRYDTRRAAWVLAALIIAKEVADLFLKSELQYIIGNVTRAPVQILVDIGSDMLFGILGGVAAWAWLRYRERRRAPETPHPIA
jgi:hypothetical protein